jgi:hypothetical protein
MSELGSVFEDEPAGPRGKDLHHPVEATRGDAASAVGAVVRVPLKLSDEDGYVIPRRVNPDDDADTIRIRLPIDSPTPVMVRLRGMGGVLDGGNPGDLYLQVTLLEGGPLTATSSDASSFVRLAPFGVLALAFAIAAATCEVPW